MLVTLVLAACGGGGAAKTPAPLPAALVPEVVEVPAGPFSMGSKSADPHVESDELPQHTLTLPTYWIGKTEVTNAQFRPFVEGDGYTNRAYWTEAGWAWRQQIKLTQPYSWNDPMWNGPTYPVVGVTWFEAVAYCRWLSAQIGVTVRLPSEAEWEKAARGTDRRIYPWGNTWDASRINDSNPLPSATGRTKPVGTFPTGASPYGALDMAGNVWEWVATQGGKRYPYQLEDEWQPAYLEARTDRVIRGGGYYYGESSPRAATRASVDPRYRDVSYDYGFRIVSRVPLPQR
ncbi:MAG: SUMF1/EgtB/PvdO family nonheme iron enzyme [Chloroflexales bacterium]